MGMISNNSEGYEGESGNDDTTPFPRSDQNSLMSLLQM